MTHQKMRLVTAIPNLFTPSKADISFESYTLSKEMPACYARAAATAAA
jgi:hypothetical protein